MSLIKAENLSLKKGSKYIVNDVNWTVDAGENWVLFGSNGCGKTTLLSILAGYTSGNGGKNYLFDQGVTKENFITLRKRIGFVSSSFFDSYLNRETVEEIVLAGKFGTLGLQGRISDEDIRKIKALGRSLGIEKKLRYPYDQLSRGQRQRVLIARALMNEPEILILDEPCSGLDIIARENFLYMIQDLAEARKMAIVYVTHHPEEISPFFNKAALMKNGEIVAQDNLKNVFSNEVLSDYFEAKTEVIWTDKHFFIEVNLPREHQSERSFSKENV